MAPNSCCISGGGGSSFVAPGRLEGFDGAGDGDGWLSIEYDNPVDLLAHSYVTYGDEELDVAAAQGVLAGSSIAVGVSPTLTLADPPDHGSLTIEDDGSFTYEPEAAYLGTDSFDVRLAADAQREWLGRARDIFDTELARMVREAADLAAALRSSARAIEAAVHEARLEQARRVDAREPCSSMRVASVGDHPQLLQQFAEASVVGPHLVVEIRRGPNRQYAARGLDLGQYGRCRGSPR